MVARVDVDISIVSASRVCAWFNPPSIENGGDFIEKERVRTRPLSTLILRGPSTIYKIHQSSNATLFGRTTSHSSFGEHVSNVLRANPLTFQRGRKIALHCVTEMQNCACVRACMQIHTLLNSPMPYINK